MIFLLQAVLVTLLPHGLLAVYDDFSINSSRVLFPLNQDKGRNRVPRPPFGWWQAKKSLVGTVMDSSAPAGNEHFDFRGNSCM